MGTARRTNHEESQTRGVVKLDFEMNFATGAAPTVIAQNECVTVTRTGPGAYTVQLLDSRRAPMAPGYARPLSFSHHFTNFSAAQVRWGNYNATTGQVPFTIHPDGAAASAAADPANAANLNLRVRLRFKNSTVAKM